MGTKRIYRAVNKIIYHLVWYTRYRRRALAGPVAEHLDQLLRAKVTELGGETIALAIQSDHTDPFAQFPPPLAVCQIMHCVKGYTSHALRRELPYLKSSLPSLWTRSHPSTSLRTGYVSTAGEMSAETIQHYIEAQEGQ